MLPSFHYISQRTVGPGAAGLESKHHQWTSRQGMTTTCWHDPRNFCCNIMWAMKKTWLFRVHRGWTTIQLCGDYFINHSEMISLSKFWDFFVSGLCLTREKSQPPSDAVPPTGPEGGWSSRNHPSVSWSQDLKGSDKWRILRNIRNGKEMHLGYFETPLNRWKNLDYVGSPSLSHDRSRFPLRLTFSAPLKSKDQEKQDKGEHRKHIENICIWCKILLFPTYLIVYMNHQKIKYGERLNMTFDPLWYFVWTKIVQFRGPRSPRAVQNFDVLDLTKDCNHQYKNRKCGRFTKKNYKTHTLCEKVPKHIHSCRIRSSFQRSRRVMEKVRTESISTMTARWSWFCSEWPDGSTENTGSRPNIPTSSFYFTCLWLLKTAFFRHVFLRSFFPSFSLKNISRLALGRGIQAPQGSLYIPSTKCDCESRFWGLDIFYKGLRIWLPMARCIHRTWDSGCMKNVDLVGWDFTEGWN